ncbi:Ras-related protein Rab-21 [Geodia barretti]|uniref:Ras-related protein Rab-21 n=1 Tax=Geodia barretti TaxID=519541 RepID=A0AA35TZ15_GEOBA|nr:Ras-related protein Rab-21 [Geodia barretti]CAI8057135.1 Ras-related protein Rab-21 [Geodia barretti]
MSLDGMSGRSAGSDRTPTIEAKVVILGTQGVGKTSLVLRHVGNTFSRNVSPTIGASFFTFSMSVGGFRIKLQLWDTAGQERFRSMAPMYYRRANAAMIVYDITREKSFQEAQEWVKELESKVDGKIALCVVGNKCDLTGEREVPKDRGETFAHQLGALFTETSAAENMGIKEAFLKVAQGVISLYQKNQLTTNPNFEPSFSPVNSHSYPPHPLAHTKQSAYFYTTRSVEANGRVMVDSSDAIHNCDSRDGSSRCCW